MEEDQSHAVAQSHEQTSDPDAGDAQHQRLLGMEAATTVTEEGGPPDRPSPEQTVASMSGTSSDSPPPPPDHHQVDSLGAVCDHEPGSDVSMDSASSKARKRSLSLDDENTELCAAGVTDDAGDDRVLGTVCVTNNTAHSDSTLQDNAPNISKDRRSSVEAESSPDVPVSETVPECSQEDSEIQIPTVVTPTNAANAAGSSKESEDGDIPMSTDYQTDDSSLGVTWSVKNGYAGCSEDGQQYGAGSADDDSSDWEGPVDVDLEESPLAHRQRSTTSPWTTLKALTKWIPLSRPRHPWVQMAGHQGSFLAGTRGNVLKLLVPREEKNLKQLMEDTHLGYFIPEYRGTVEKDGACYIQLQDLLCEFSSPCVMDIKMGVRTYPEEELEKARKKPTLRKDMFQKMVSIDPDAPTEEEKKNCAINKPRYLKFRDDMSSSSSLGFRIEGIKTHSGASKDYKNTRTRDDVKKELSTFIGENVQVLEKYISRMNEIREAQESSTFFQSHEMVGSSLLFVHDDSGKAGVWMIDFAKCNPLPPTADVDHRAPWIPGNFQDGYLFGIDNLKSLLEEVKDSKTVGL